MLSEFDFIHYIKERYGLRAVGDDSAVLPKDDKADLVVTADLLIEDIDFRLEWTTPELLGHKALAVSLSDIAAMGGDPKWAMLSIGVPEKIWNSGFVQKFYEGWFGLAKEFGVELVGGDVSRSPERLVVDSIIGGEVKKGGAILRSTVNVGDAIFVSGALGGAGGGLKLLEAGVRYSAASAPEQDLIERQLKPNPRVELAATLREVASAMIDISDGLSTDLAHICESSGVGALIEASKIPCDRNLSAIGLSKDRALDLALNGGEDFELLFTCDQSVASSLNGKEITIIGEITSRVGDIRIVRNGRPDVLEQKGFQHFG